MKQIRLSSLLLKRLESPGYTLIQFARLLTTTRYNAIKHLPDNVNIINQVWRSSAILYLLSLKFQTIQKLIISIHECHLGNKWTTLLDKLSTSKIEDQNMLPMFLLQILLLESISKEKDYKLFWTPAYKELSEKLLSPAEIDSAALVSNCCNKLSKKAAGKLPCLTMSRIKVQNRNLLKTSFQLSTSTVVKKWANEVTPIKIIKAVKIKLKPSCAQKTILDDWINTSNYVYNKTVETIYKKHHQANFQNLRDLLVTANTKKHNVDYILISNNIKRLGSDKSIMKQELKQLSNIHNNNTILIQELTQRIYDIETTIKNENARLRAAAKLMDAKKNEGIHEWELNTPKEVRAGSVNDVCKAIKSGKANLKAGNIKNFRLSFRKKSENYKCAVIPKHFLKNKNGIIQLAPEFFKEHCKFKMGKKTMKKPQNKNLEINYDSRIVKQMNDYWLIVPVSVKIEEKTTPVNYCGVDPGVRTFMTTFGTHGCTEYDFNYNKIQNIDDKIKQLKFGALGKRNRVPRNKIIKCERRKENIINELHWSTINNLLKTHDFIFYGDINSHSIVKHGKNHTLNTKMNNLKFFKFKQRLLFKATERNKKVYLVHEAHTSQTCCMCGSINNPGDSKIYSCTTCDKKIGRDVNAAKNILMKGIVRNL